MVVVVVVVLVVGLVGGALLGQKPRPLNGNPRPRANKQAGPTFT